MTTRVFAHRGFRSQYPENTLLAFEKALEANAYGIELDVQLSSDGEIVIMHDETVDRTTNGTGLILDKTLAELKALDAGQGQQIPTLDEYFALVQNTKVITNIELKNNIRPYPGLEEKVLERVKAYGLSDRIIFSSFNHEAVIRCKALAPEIPGGLLCGHMDDFSPVLERMRQHGIEYLNPFVESLTDALLRSFQRDGVKLMVWTVNDPEQMRRLASYGVFGFFADDPVTAISVLDSVGAEMKKGGFLALLRRVFGGN